MSTRRPTKLLLLALAVSLLLAPAVASVGAASSWMRSGYDPARTGAIPFQGPQANVTAFEVQLPGTPFGETLLQDGYAYLRTSDVGLREDLNESAIWRIDLNTAEVDRLYRIPDGMHPIFPSSLLRPGLLILHDGNTYHAQEQHASELLAVDIPSGEELWRVEAMADDPTPVRSYVGMVERDNVLYVGVVMGLPPASKAGVVAVDLTSGEELWTWTRGLEDTDEVGIGEVPVVDVRDRTMLNLRLSAGPDRLYPYAILSESVPGVGSRIQYELWALDAASGAPLWNQTDTAQHYTPVPAAGLGPGGFRCCGYAAVTDNLVHLRLDNFVGLNPQTGEIAMSSPAGARDQVEIQGTTGVGVRASTLIGTSDQTLYRIDTVDGDILWQRTGSLYTGDPVVLSEDTAYVTTRSHREHISAPGVEAVDLETGEVRWEWMRYPSVGFEGSGFTPNEAAYGDGVMVVGTKDGVVTVLGETEASLGRPQAPDVVYPPDGEPVTLELAPGEPGAFGEATRYRVDWGDGTVSPWQASPTFEHTYNETGQVIARVYAGNQANQTASATVNMRVGEAPPTEPNLVETAFQRENQDLTFGILGILVAVTGGAIGVTSRYRKRSRLQDELETLEAGFEETRERPSECEALIDTRKARARSLALDGQLDEGQVGILEARAEELRARLRQNTLEEEFAFLPYGLVRAAREMVEDGRVSALERQAFLRAVDEDDVLSSQQKAVVRDRIEAWHARDAGGGRR